MTKEPIPLNLAVWQASPTFTARWLLQQEVKGEARLWVDKHYLKMLTKGELPHTQVNWRKATDARGFKVQQAWWSFLAKLPHGLTSEQLYEQALERQQEANPRAEASPETSWEALQSSLDEALGRLYPIPAQIIPFPRSNP